MRIAAMFANFGEEKEEDVEILDVSQNCKQDLSDPFDDVFIEADEGSDADEGLGSEIISPKKIQTNEEETQQHATKVEEVLKDNT